MGLIVIGQSFFISLLFLANLPIIIPPYAIEIYAKIENKLNIIACFKFKPNVRLAAPIIVSKLIKNISNISNG